MPLPFRPPLEPMLAKLTTRIPEGPAGGGWLYEPKWDGFRALVWKDGSDVFLQSRDLKPLARYFPELAAGLAEALDHDVILDGEIVIERDGKLDFDALLLRIHPAASRIELLARDTPASFVAWDLLALDGEDLRERPLAERRALLERTIARAGSRARPPLWLAPATTSARVAADWFETFEGAGLDGVVSKRLDGPYIAGQRVMVKTKPVRTAECVVVGFRWFKGHPDELVGSLLLGLYADDGSLHNVGVCAAFSREKRAELVRVLAPFRQKSRERKIGESSRWSRGRDVSFEALKPELVVEVAYDHLQGDRFRHATQFVRFRPDKPARDCRYDQLEAPSDADVRALLTAPRTSPRRRSRGRGAPASGAGARGRSSS